MEDSFILLRLGKEGVAGKAWVADAYLRGWKQRHSAFELGEPIL